MLHRVALIRTFLNVRPCGSCKNLLVALVTSQETLFFPTVRTLRGIRCVTPRPVAVSTPDATADTGAAPEDCI
jgi:hypothetical protein